MLSWKGQGQRDRDLCECNAENLVKFVKCVDTTTDSFYLDAESCAQLAVKCLTRYAVNGICWTCVCNAEKLVKF